MRYLDGMSQTNIAKALGLSEGYVSKLLARALQSLRALDWEVDSAS
jgi:DNA-directed RNA polymerase specialized sigma subunit